MEIPAGWYDAGVAGRERWWDGTRWTEHEREILQQHAPAGADPRAADAHPSTGAPPGTGPRAADARAAGPAPAPAASAQTAAAAAQGIPMGWYDVPGGGGIRWRDDRHWTPYRIVDGKPGANWYATEPPLIGYVFGGFFLMIALAQFALAGLSRQFPVNGILMLLLAVFWMSAGIAGSVVRSRPAPLTTALAPECALPLPGQTEGPGAGWYAVSGSLSRWWSGTRWAHYVAQAGRVRPTFNGERTYRVMLIMAAAMTGLGVVALVVGAILLAAVEPPPWPGVFLLIAGIVLGVVGAILFPVIRLRRPAFLLPEHPPVHAA
ncbi:DUF2510 domain-containing protein [Leucobacter sp. CSA1]|uniref:DUF2510 domain-containing protein n=1 Tax=Leucobacter chromiisoli TaxID=2796471 RepID=A0A934USW6_9MICO|nr:DUF2510 domain-containing protein [Leucobacter chromiisoli]MBK0417739.1 DUF2510 domain-containing protein [Leucobacter chromiisoli]